MNTASRTQNWLDGFLPLLAQKDADSLRFCRLIIGFGFLGGAFGLIFAAFYCSIGHYYGAAIVAFCDLCFIAVPWMLKYARGGVAFHGHFLCAILTIGFASLAA